MGSACKSPTPLHLHKCVTRFVVVVVVVVVADLLSALRLASNALRDSDSRVSFLYLYVDSFTTDDVQSGVKHNIGCSDAILLLNQQLIILWSVAVVYMQQFQSS